MFASPARRDNEAIGTLAAPARLGYRSQVTRTLILSHETVCQLLEAHASLAAWYYRHSDALRAAGAEAEAPDELQLRAFLEQLATGYPEVADVARSITQPRAYIPPPVFTAPPAAVPPPADAAAAVAASPPEAAPPVAAAPPPPPPVQPPATVDPPAQVPERKETGGSDAAASDDGVAPPPPSTSSDGAVAPPPMVDPKKVRYD